MYVEERGSLTKSLKFLFELNYKHISIIETIVK